MSTKRLAPLLVSVLLVVAASSAGSWAAGTETDTPAIDPAIDPVIADVVRMLGERVEPAIIEAWLESNEAWPARISPDDLVALTRAGAPESLIRDLLEHSGSAEQEPAPAAAAAPTDDEPAARGGAMAVSGGVMAKLSYPEIPPVEFSVKYRRLFDESANPEPPWELYLYLDGRPLASYLGGTSSLFGSGKTLRFDLALAPGKHSLRILQERHLLESKKKDRWSHEARVYPRTVELEVRAGSAHALDLFVNETAPVWSKNNGPVSFTLVRDGVTLSGVQGDGPDTNEWPVLCEEAETGIPPEKRDTRSAQRALEGCLRWSALWPEAPDAPDRDSIRQELAGQDYRPLPENWSKAP
jgi:hypothetical protein